MAFILILAFSLFSSGIGYALVRHDLANLRKGRQGTLDIDGISYDRSVDGAGLFGMARVAIWLRLLMACVLFLLGVLGLLITGAGLIWS